MSYVVGIAWFKDELTYRKALAIFTDKDMPATYDDWLALVKRQLAEIKAGGNTAIRADINPETFTDWCNVHGLPADSHGRMEFVKYIELEYQKTGKGTLIE